MEEKSIRLVSCDGQGFDVDKRAVSRSMTIMKKLQLRPNSPVVLDKIDGKTLEKVIEYCIHHNVAFNKLDDEDVVSRLQAFDADFMNVDVTTFFNLNEAAYYLKIQLLVDLTCGTLSKMFMGKNYKEIGEVIENWN